MIVYSRFLQWPLHPHGNVHPSPFCVHLQRRVTQETRHLHVVSSKHIAAIGLQASVEAEAPQHLFPPVPLPSGAGRFNSIPKALLHTRV
jgi:hypothetical protein